MFNRFIPAWCAIFALIGCFVPGNGSLIFIPASYDITPAFHGNPRFADMAKTMFEGIENAKPSLDTAWWLSLLVYAVPLSAVTIMFITLRGFVSKRLQILTATIWLLLGIVLPIATNAIAMHGFAQIKLLSLGMQVSRASPLRFNAGDWLIGLAAVTLLLAANGIIKYVETPSQPSPSAD